ncbi:hypothetical protein NDI42_27365 [Funiculus sociatus GB2-C1]|nr:hypothetical protein [Trichocoleus sp. FACHB-69]
MFFVVGDRFQHNQLTHLTLPVVTLTTNSRHSDQDTELYGFSLPQG